MINCRNDLLHHGAGVREALNKVHNKRLHVNLNPEPVEESVAGD
jgi:hypothetical protein